jgi:hypothetical protein
MKTKMRHKKLLIGLGIGVAMLFLTAAFGGSMSASVIRVFGDSMDWRSRRLMGSHGIDCGRVKVNGDPKIATDCAMKAESGDKPFRVRYDILGYDSAVAGGVVRTPSGELYALSFDGNPSGAGGTSLLRQRSSESPCPKPYHLWVNPKGRINCFQQQLAQPKDLMSPNMEAY